MIRDEATVGFDYNNDVENMKRYGHAKPPVLPLYALKNLKVPVSLFVGEHDILSTIEDDKIIRDRLGDVSMHHYEEVNADHLSLLIGSDMTYFT